MMRCGGLLFVATMGLLLAPSNAYSAVANSLLFNEGNAVSGSKFLQGGNSDVTFGRVEGNGQNWFELLVVQGDETGGDAFKNTLDLRGWTINWSYDKATAPNEEVQHGSGVIKFSEDPLWATVPKGTLITVSEWHDAWYEKTLDTTPGINGYHRAGGINGLGNPRGVAYDAGLHNKIGATAGNPDPHLLWTDTSWNPAANGGGANGDWRIHVFAGERNPDQSYQVFHIHREHYGG